MKIAIPVNEKKKNADVDRRFGRAPFFAIYDVGTKEFSYVENSQNLNSAQGAGIQSAENIVKAGAEVLLTSSCGPKAFRVLAASDVKVITGVFGNVEEALKKYEAGEYKAAEGADVEGHWV